MLHREKIDWPSVLGPQPKVVTPRRTSSLILSNDTWHDLARLAKETGHPRNELTERLLRRMIDSYDARAKGR